MHQYNSSQFYCSEGSVEEPQFEELCGIYRRDTAVWQLIQQRAAKIMALRMVRLSRQSEKPREHVQSREANHSSEYN